MPKKVKSFTKQSLKKKLFKRNRNKKIQKED